MKSQLWAYLLRNPRTTGSLLPSSACLARAMAQEAQGAERVLELGAGTGPVTQALLHLYPATLVHSVELQPQLAALLQERFAGLHVTQGCALQALSQAPANQRIVVVSSLPFRSLPLAFRERFAAELQAFLARNPQAWLVQFTYQPRAPFKAPAGWGWSRGPLVLGNLPPARVWCLRPSPSKA